MRINQKYIAIGVVIALLISLGSGYAIGKMEVKQANEKLSKATLENQELKKQVETLTKGTDASAQELAKIKSQIQDGPSLEPYMLEAIKRAGVDDPAKLIEDLKQNPSVIPEEAVLGGTMQFNQVALINERWVYGAYEDGHVAGSAVFQWEMKDSRLIWTPVLVFKE